MRPGDGAPTKGFATCHPPSWKSAIFCLENENIGKYTDRYASKPCYGSILLNFAFRSKHILLPVRGFARCPDRGLYFDISKTSPHPVSASCSPLKSPTFKTPWGCRSCRSYGVRSRSASAAIAGRLFSCICGNLDNRPISDKEVHVWRTSMALS